MSKLEFMKQLEYLVQDITEDDKRDAIQYYYDYFEDAGEENEDSIIRELGSPERIAAIIRADLNSLLEEGGEFSEIGYSDDRYKEPKLSLSEYAQVAVVEEPFEKKPLEKNKTLYTILLIIAAMIFIPVLWNVVGGGIGLVTGFAGIILALLIILGTLTFGVLVGGIAVFIAGISFVFVNPLSGMLLIGCGICIIGIGLLLLALSLWFYKTVVPNIVRAVINFCSSLFQKFRKGGKAK